MSELRPIGLAMANVVAVLRDPRVPSTPSNDTEELPVPSTPREEEEAA